MSARESELLIRLKDEPEAIEKAPPSNVLEAIVRAAADPRVDVQKLRELLELQERVEANQRKMAFNAAMARLQAKLPQIRKDGRIIVKGTERSRFARLEDIDVAIRPLMAEEGFSFSFNEESAEGNSRRYSAKLAHRDGHSETKYITLPLDASDYRSACQSAGSTHSYARRYLIKSHLNIIEREEDDDGNGGSSPITEEQVHELAALIDEVGADKKRFLSYMGVDALGLILAKDFKSAVTALEAKRRK